VAAAELAGALKVLAVLVRYMEATSETPAEADAPHPAIQLLQHAYPLLEAVALSPALQGDEQVYNALCEVRRCTPLNPMMLFLLLSACVGGL